MNNAVAHLEDKLQYEIDSWDLSEALKAGKAIVVIDARSPAAFTVEHLSHAINLPHGEMNPETTLRFDNEKLYVTYCDGIGCNASTKGALRMTQLGFHAKELIGGIDWWKRDGHPTQLAVVDIQI